MNFLNSLIISQCDVICNIASTDDLITLFRRGISDTDHPAVKSFYEKVKTELTNRGIDLHYLRMSAPPEKG